MNNINKVLILLLLGVSFMGCMYIPEGTGAVVISLPGSRAVSGGPSGISGPPGISGYTLIVKNGYGLIERSYPADARTISLDVTPGKDILIQLIAQAKPSVQEAVLSWKGEEVISLEAGEIRKLSLFMDVYETKILVPDYLGERLVAFNRFNDLSMTSTWQVVDSNTFYQNGFFDASAMINDVDLDARGRIYLAKSSHPEGIFRMDDLSGSSMEYWVENSTDIPGSRDVFALTIDRRRGIVYFLVTSRQGTPDGNVYYREISFGSTVKTLNLSDDFGVNTLVGLAVDEDGFLYLANNYMEGPSIVKIDPIAPAGEMVCAEFDIFSLANLTDFVNSDTFTDIVVKDGFVYFSVVGDEANGIVQLDLDLEYVNHVTASMVSQGSGISLYGPRLFFNTTSPGLYFIDEGSGYPVQQQLVYLPRQFGLKPDGWRSLAENEEGEGIGEFTFFLDLVS